MFYPTLVIILQTSIKKIKKYYKPWNTYKVVLGVLSVTIDFNLKRKHIYNISGGMIYYYCLNEFKGFKWYPTHYLNFSSIC